MYREKNKQFYVECEKWFDNDVVEITHDIINIVSCNKQDQSLYLALM